MVNSVKDLMTEADTISEITLMLGQNKNRVCVVVEGEDDQKIFGHLLAPNVDLFPSYAPKRGVEEIVKNHFPRNKRVLGIRDKDYCKRKLNSRIFFCDYCCAEMMIVSIESCFMRLYCNFYKGDEKPNELLLKCLNHLEMLSKIRMLNENKKWMIKLNGINVATLYNEKIDEMDASIINEINTQNPNNQLDDLRKNKCVTLPKCTSLHDYLNITNGHDFVRLFSKLCPKQSSYNSISLALRSALGKSEFKQTNLYRELYTYQYTKNLSVVE